MDCVSCEEHFSALLEGNEAAAVQQSREHLAGCPACQGRYEAFRQTVHHLRALPVVAPPPGLQHAIQRALEEETPPRGFMATYWQPLTAGLSLAACCLMVLWAVVLHPVGMIVTTDSSQFVQSGPSLLTSPVVGSATPVRPAGATTPVSAASASPPRREANPRAEARHMATRPRASQGPIQFFPPGFGEWGQRLPITPVSAAGETVSAASDKPAGTFAANDSSVSAPAPLRRSPGEVQLSFTPPVERVAGTPAVGQLLVVGQAEAQVTLRLQTRSGLRVLNAPGGVLYQGALRKGEKLELPVRLLAVRPGSHRLLLRVEADVAGLGTELPILIPNFAAAANPEQIVALTFRDTPAVRAIRELAAAAGVKVVLAEDLSRELVTYDFSDGVPFAVALQTLCDGCGYKLEVRDGVYHVGK